MIMIDDDKNYDNIVVMIIMIVGDDYDDK